MLTALPTPRASISTTRPGRGPVPLRLADVRFFDEVANVCAAHARRGSAPRIGDLAVRLKVSRSIVAGHVARLIGLELVARTNHGALSIVRALSRRERRTAGASC